MANIKYLIDSDVFIQAKNLFYRFDFCMPFWEWISDAHAAGLVFTIDKVKNEITDGDADDPARVWIENAPNSFFLKDTGDANVMKSYATTIKWATDSTHYTPLAIKDYANHSKADAFLVATAMHHSHVIVTQERSDPACKKRIPLPDAADAVGVKTIHVYDMLSMHSTPAFKLK